MVDRADRKKSHTMFCPVIKAPCKVEKCMFYLPEGGNAHTFCCMVLGFLYGLEGTSSALKELSIKIDTFNEIFSSREIGDYLEAIGNIGRDITAGLEKGRE